VPTTAPRPPGKWRYSVEDDTPSRAATSSTVISGSLSSALASLSVNQRRCGTQGNSGFSTQCGADQRRNPLLTHIINCGERFRSGERISSAMAESTVNAVVSKRFAKRQQMQWTRRGTHLLLQTRTRALDGTLRPMFERWYPGLANDNPASTGQAAAA